MDSTTKLGMFTKPVKEEEKNTTNTIKMAKNKLMRVRFELTPVKTAVISKNKSF